MMNGRKTKHLFAGLGLLALLLMGLANLPGMVFCVEPDGRISIENAVGGVCLDSVQDALQQVSIADASQKRLQADHCKHCVDIPISMEHAKRQSQTSHAFPKGMGKPLLAQAFGNNLGYLAIATRHLLPQPPPQRPNRHYFLETVVLLL